MPPYQLSSCKIHKLSENTKFKKIFYSKTYIHVIGQASQGQTDVTAILHDTLLRLKALSDVERFPANRVYIRSDNAGINEIIINKALCFFMYCMIHCRLLQSLNYS